MSAPFFAAPVPAAAAAAPSASAVDDASSSSSSHRASIKTPVGGGKIQTLKRAQVFAELNRARRAENFNKRRRGHETPADGAAAGAQAADGHAAATVPLSEAEVQTLLTTFRAAYVASSTDSTAPTVVPSPAVPASERARLLRQLRLLLSNDDAPVAAAVSAGVVPCLVAELGAHAAGPVAAAAASSSDAGASSQLDAVWCLTNIACDTTAHTRAVLPAAPALISFLSSANVRMQEGCVWCISNIAGEEQECRTQLLNNGVLLPLVRLLQQACPSSPPAAPAPVPAPSDPAQLSLARAVSWCLSNLIKTSRSAAKAAAGAGATPDIVAKHLAAFVGVAPQLLPILFTLLRSSDEALATEVMWIVAAWANHGEAVLASLVQGGLLPALLARMFLLRSSPIAQGPGSVTDPATGLERDPLATALIPIVRVLGNLAHAHDAMLQQLLSLQLPAIAATGTAVAVSPPSAVDLVFSTLERSLSSLHRGLKKEACWVVSNLAATGLPNVHAALVLNERNEAGVFVHALFRLLRAGSFDLQREAAHALYNLCRCGDGRYMSLLLPRVNESDPVASAASPTVLLLRSFCDLLRSRDPEAVLISLRLLELLLSTHPDGVRLVEREGGIDALESVQQGSENAQLVDYAHQLVDKYFGAGEEEEDEQTETAAAQDDDLPAWRVQHQHNNQTAPPTGPPSGGFSF